MNRIALPVLLSLPVLVAIGFLGIVLYVLNTAGNDLQALEEKALQQSANSLAAVIAGDDRFLREIGSLDQVIYRIESLPGRPVVDGRSDDWPVVQAETLGLSHLLEINFAYTEETLNYQLRIGEDAEDLFLFYRVVDDFVVLRQINHPSVHRNDHIQIAFLGSDDLFRRYTIAAIQPGHVEAMEIGHNGRALRAAPAINGRWLATEDGYNVELKIPKALLTTRFSTLVADVDEEGRSVRSLVGRSHTTETGVLGSLISSPTPLELLINGLPWDAVVYDAAGIPVAGTMPTSSADFHEAKSVIRSGDDSLGELWLRQPILPNRLTAGSFRTQVLVISCSLVFLVLVLMFILRRRLLKSLDDTNREIEQVRQYNEYLERMASRLSHELQTPISVIRSSIDHLQTQAGQESVYVERAAEGIQRLATILDKMAEARRLEEALDEDEITRFNLAEVVKGCVEGYRLAFGGQTFELSIEAADVPVTGIPELIAQCFDKIVDNAVEFSTGGAVRVRLTIDEDRAMLRVMNEGPCLPTGSIESLFESMVSVRESQRTHLGLGLYVAKTIAEYHGGELTLKNREDTDGVIATLQLPILRVTARLS
ncbi:MAG: hypothetical protein HOC70_14310 [Gammaproteobacteria bacterium]|jgi:signal transduction histidine kinase|nr:hypothetical protein [Gammaproteobacteria bacterium]MBT4494411.1 hypothetical protein [Gammaproteobacteria bacterium]MBT7369985.1 hypothetical protein [Gammaproteobacteria bacterium]